MLNDLPSASSNIIVDYNIVSNLEIFMKNLTFVLSLEL